MRIAAVPLPPPLSPRSHLRPCWRARLQPLTLAMLCLSLSQAVQATAENSDAQNTTVQTNDDTVTTPDQSIATPITPVKPSGYLSREAFQALQTQELLAGQAIQRTPPAQRCHGVWVTPISAAQKPAQPIDPQTPITATADYAYYHPTEGSTLSGTVQLQQHDRLLNADTMTLDPSQTLVEATGHVRLAEAGIVSEGERLRYDLQNQTAEFSNSQYISESLQAHGSAEQLSRDTAGVITLRNTAYSTCEPNNAVWTLKAKQLELNPTTGRGTAKNTKLYVYNTPILALPWFDFPIDDRRSSGFLAPSAGYTNDGGLEFSLPYYFNLAPNYDLTLVPRLLSQRKVMLEGEFRALTPHYGRAVISGGYLPNDPRFNQQDRSQISLKHEWQISDSVRSVLNLNDVSDKDYFTDLGTDILARNSLNQERSLSLFYQSGSIAGLDATFRVQDFQTVDPNTPDIDRPYARLPQLLLNYQRQTPEGWRYQAQQDSAYFQRRIQDGSGIENSGLRVYHHVNASYPFRQSWGYIQPEISAQHLFYQFDDNSLNSQKRSEDDATRSAFVPQISLDMGLMFERNGKHRQTLEPRLFYAYAPFKSQDDFPNFDSTTISRSYNQLFSTERFIGHDRLEDNHFISLGVVHRLYDLDGAERLRLAAGQTRYFDDRRVRLQPTDPISKEQTSGPAVELSAQLTTHLRLDTSALWQANGNNTSSLTQLNYQHPQGTLYHAGYIERRQISTQNQQAFRQGTLGIIQPLNNQWRAFGYLQYDFDKQVTRDGLFGLDYNGCCFRAALYGRSFFNDLDDPSITAPRRLIMAELTFKGLGGLSGGLG